MSIGSPVWGSVPGRIDPSDMITAGALCSRIAASVPDRRLVAGDDGDHPAQVAALQVQAHAVVGGSPGRSASTHLRRAVALAVGESRPRSGRDDPHRQVGATTRRRSSAWIASTFAGTPA